MGHAPLVCASTVRGMRAVVIFATGLILSVVGCHPQPVDTAAQAKAVQAVLQQKVQGGTLGDCLNIAGGWDVNPATIAATTIRWPSDGEQAWRVSIPSEGAVKPTFMRFGVDLASGRVAPMGDGDMATLDATGCNKV